MNSLQSRLTANSNQVFRQPSQHVRTSTVILSITIAALWLLVLYITTANALGREDVYSDSLVIAIDGAGTLHKTSYSIYFGPDSLHNEASLLPGTAPKQGSGFRRGFATLAALANK
ncbi:hypothetical protein BDZ45DRAFT_748512 [Acephala macrosclerotiorum]|nr:hypothetical protein BDZ45DRAFT_748512 [Acephala macrosclerotiorum]